MSLVHLSTELVTFPVPHAVTRVIGGESVGGQALGLGELQGCVSDPSVFFVVVFFFEIFLFLMWAIFKGLLNLLHITCFIFQFFGCKAHGILAPRTGVKPTPLH